MEISQQINLLGKHESDESIQSFLQSIEGKKIVERESDGIYYTFHDKGLELTFDARGFLLCIFFKTRGDIDEDLACYKGCLPNELLFNMNQSSVRNKIGNPRESGKASTWLNTIVLPWDKYYFETYNLHIQYEENLNTINQITIERS